MTVGATISRACGARIGAAGARIARDRKANEQIDGLMVANAVSSARSKPSPGNGTLLA